MNTLLFRTFFILIFLNSYSLIACGIDSTLEIRAAAFFHSSDRFRDIYGNESGCYQLEASAKLYKCWDSWANLDWFSKHGKSENFKEPTKVRIVNFSFGVKFPYQLSKDFTAYVGIGPSFARIYLKNKLHHDHESLSKLASGGVLKTGIYYTLTSRVFMDFFLDYLYQPVKFDSSIDIGGLKVGLGIGARF